MKTVGINDEIHSRLKVYCNNQDLNLGEFIDCSLSYFEKTGSNPKLDEAPRDEINKLIKRLDQVIAFIRSQEKEYIRPAFEQVSIIEKRLKQDLENFTSRKDVNDLSGKINAIVEQLNNILSDYKNLIIKYEGTTKIEKDSIKQERMSFLNQISSQNKELKLLISLILMRSDLSAFDGKKKSELNEQINQLLK